MSERLLRNIEADLLWLTLERRWDRARQILTNSEMQAAIIAAQSYGGSGGGQGATAWSDPTGEGATGDASTEVRATKILSIWLHEIDVIGQHVWFVADAYSQMFDDPLPPVRAGAGVHAKLATITARLSWLLIVPQDRYRQLYNETRGTELGNEVEHSIDEAALDARALRDGWLRTETGAHVPSVFGVLESARIAMKVQPPPEPKPVQKPLEGCVSCKRNAGHFSPIDVVHYSKKNLCTMCGNHWSGHDELPPVGALKYVHRTGKKLSWKIIQEAKRSERAS